MYGTREPSLRDLPKRGGFKTNPKLKREDLFLITHSHARGGGWGEAKRKGKN